MKTREKEFTEAEALEYFNKIMADYKATVIKGEWEKYKTEAIPLILSYKAKDVLDLEEHYEWTYEIHFVLTDEFVHTFSVWMEPNGVYGEW